MKLLFRATFGVMLLALCSAAIADKGPVALQKEARNTMRKAAEFFRYKVASHGGYVYYCSLDLKQRRGEVDATIDQIWVEPPGTPTVGMAYLTAYAATADQFYLDAALETGEALIYGQLKSGGWSHAIDFNPKGKQVAQYRNGQGGGKNYSTFDDNKTQSALRMLMRLDKALEFKNERVHEVVEFALKAVLAAQFPNGAFPQGWQGAVEKHPVVQAAYPDYEWRSEGRIKNYWDLYTLNDNLAGDVTKMLQEAHEIYGGDQYMNAIRRLGDFLVQAQMPEPQPAWAQQYNYTMHPAWARKFEPPAITGAESQDVMWALMEIYCLTGDQKYLKPIPRALEYFKASLLSDGRLARFYELRTNKPLYMVCEDKVYTLTYDDSNTPSHYSWKVDAGLKKIESRYQKLLQSGVPARDAKGSTVSEKTVQRLIQALDESGRWLSRYGGNSTTSQPKFADSDQCISSKVFCNNMNTLSAFVAQ